MRLDIAERAAVGTDHLAPVALGLGALSDGTQGCPVLVTSEPLVRPQSGDRPVHVGGEDAQTSAVLQHPRDLRHGEIGVQPVPRRRHERGVGAEVLERDGLAATRGVRPPRPIAPPAPRASGRLARPRSRDLPSVRSLGTVRHVRHANLPRPRLPAALRHRTRQTAARAGLTSVMGAEVLPLWGYLLGTHAAVVTGGRGSLSRASCWLGTIDTPILGYAA